jgi:hypothetical protein
MPRLTSDEYIKEAQLSARAAEEWREKGNSTAEKRALLRAILNLLRAAARRVDGQVLMRQEPMVTLLRTASLNDSECHPTYLLDSAHVALLAGEPKIANKWLILVASNEDWSQFWARYAKELLSLINSERLKSEPVALDVPEQAEYLPYFDFMRALVSGSSEKESLDAVREWFAKRQRNAADPGLLDGSPGDPILWDWRYETIVLAAGVTGSRPR